MTLAKGVNGGDYTQTWISRKEDSISFGCGGVSDGSSRKEGGSMDQVSGCLAESSQVEANATEDPLERLCRVMDIYGGIL